jgi:predicted ester cyclase
MADLKEIIQRGNRLFNERDVAGLIDLYTDDAESIGPGGMVAKGKAEIRKLLEGWLQGFPDARIHDHNVIVGGNTVVTEGVFRGTHTGIFPTPMGDIPPTGRSVEGPYVDVFEFEGDKVKSDRLTFDRMQLMEQLGLAPTPAAAGASN